MFPPTFTSSPVFNPVPRFKFVSVLNPVPSVTLVFKPVPTLRPPPTLKSTGLMSTLIPPPSPAPRLTSPPTLKSTGLISTLIPPPKPVPIFTSPPTLMSDLRPVSIGCIPPDILISDFAFPQQTTADFAPAPALISTLTSGVLTPIFPEAPTPAPNFTSPSSLTSPPIFTSGVFKFRFTGLMTILTGFKSTCTGFTFKSRLTGFKFKSTFTGFTSQLRFTGLISTFRGLISRLTGLTSKWRFTGLISK